MKPIFLLYFFNLIFTEMPSLQHSFVKMSLHTASYAFQFSKPSVVGLRSLLDLSTLYTFLPWGVHFREQPIGALYAEWLSTDASRTDKVMLYLHGGAYAIGSPHTHRSFVGQLVKKTKINALVIDYRKAPEHVFPAALDDALQAYDWLLAQGYHPKSIIIAGDSAGGGLSLACLVALRERKSELPLAGILLSPWVDLEITGESVAKNLVNDKILNSLELHHMGAAYAGKEPLNHPLISPLHASLKGLPPLLIQVSDGEVLYSDALRLQAKAEKATVKVELQVWKDLIHWWHLFWHIMPEANEAIEGISDFIKVQMRLEEAVS